MNKITRYIFGVEQTRSNKDAFKKHQRVCPFCKSEGNMTRLQKYQDGKKYTLLECACGGVLEPKQATKENLEAFNKFRNYEKNIQSK